MYAHTFETAQPQMIQRETNLILVATHKARVHTTKILHGRAQPLTWLVVARVRAIPQTLTIVYAHTALTGSTTLIELVAERSTYERRAQVLPYTARILLPCESTAVAAALREAGSF